MSEVKCEACGVVKVETDGRAVFKTWLSEQGKAPHMTADAFYAKCCVHARKPGCINTVKSDAKPEDFDKIQKQKFGVGTDDFLQMVKELTDDHSN